MKKALYLMAILLFLPACGNSADYMRNYETTQQESVLLFNCRGAGVAQPLLTEVLAAPEEEEKRFNLGSETRKRLNRG